MDALKKAEQDKKKAAERLQQVEADAHREVEKDSNLETDDGVSRSARAVSNDTGEGQILPDTVSLSLQPIQEVEGELPAEESESVADTDSGVAEEATYDGDGTQQALRIDVTDQHEAISDTAEIASPSVGINDVAGIEELSTDIPSAPFDDTFHGVVFNGEPEQTEIFKETLPGVTATNLIKDIGGGKDQPTPVVAQTVFTAGASSRTGQTTKWSVFIMFGVVAILAYGTFYYFTITPVTRDIPSPDVARGIETTIAPPSEVAILQDTDAEVLITAETAEERTQIETMEDQAVPVDTVYVLHETEPVQTADITETIVEPVVEQMIEQDEPQIIEQEQFVVDSDISDQEFGISKDEHVEVETLPASITIEPALIQISKTSSPDQHSMAITRAYAAYVANRYTDAEAAYKEVLAEMPENRDALLGLGAIAMRNGDHELAYNHYLHLLDLNPSDSVALTALVNLSVKNDPVKSESTIKFLLNKNPKAAYLYFTLGNIYSSQLRWAEAQQAYFNAYSLESGNPDYALNLAVSLDHIGQFKTALEYYNVALGLADLNMPGFNTTSVISRIQALSGIVNSQS
jgi:Flp pilus assembly protein TadD